MLERKKTVSIPKEIINEEIIDIPPVPAMTKSLTGQEIAYLCSELTTIPQIFASGSFLSVLNTNKHLKIVKKILAPCEAHQNIVMGIIHKISDSNLKIIQIHLLNNNAQTLELYSAILKQSGKNFEVNLRQENENYFVEVSYSC